jgi:hypothetical protein
MDNNDSTARPTTGAAGATSAGRGTTLNTTGAVPSGGASATGASGQGLGSGQGIGSQQGGGSQQGQSRGLADRIRQGASTQLGTQKDRATEGLGSVAQAVRQTTQQLRDQKHDTVARYAEQAADQIERLSNRLKDKDVNELMRDAQMMARRQPALFVGTAFAIGLLGARFFKSSADATQPRGMREYRPAENWR